jgi:HAD superfamily hydrolase (TIGR01509 family)
MLTALIFDFDGTLLDTETPEFHAWQQVYREHGTDLALADWLEGVGTWYAFDPYTDLEQKHGRPIDRDAVRARVRALLDPMLNNEGLREGVAHVLKDAKRRKLALAVASSSGHAWVDGHLGRCGLLGFFDTVKCREDVAPGRSKPHPDLYLAALAALGARAGEAVAFEDSLNGVRAAKAAGIYTVAVANAITEHMTLDEADLLMRSFEDVSLDALMTRLRSAKS